MQRIVRLHGRRIELRDSERARCSCLPCARGNGGSAGCLGLHDTAVFQRQVQADAGAAQRRIGHLDLAAMLSATTCTSASPRPKPGLPGSSRT